jgi:hypothetical protein
VRGRESALVELAAACHFVAAVAPVVEAIPSSLNAGSAVAIKYTMPRKARGANMSIPVY